MGTDQRISSDPISKISIAALNDIQKLTLQQTIKVREFAAGCLAKKDNDGLSCALPDEYCKLLDGVHSQDFSVHGNQLHFSDIDTRDKLAAEHFYFDKADEDSTDHISVALKIRNQEGWKERGSAGRYLALVNREVDIFKSAAETIQERNHRTFDVLDVVQSALPHIEKPSIEGLLSLCEAQHEPTKNDLMRGCFFTVFEDCFENDMEVFREIIVATHDNLSEATSSLYTMSVIKISVSEPQEAIDLVFQDVEGTSSILKKNATWALGRLILLDRMPEQKLHEAVPILKTSAAVPDEGIRHAAYMAIVEGALIHSPLTDLLNDLLESNDQALLGSLAGTLFQRSKQVESNPHIDHWLMSLANLSPESIGAIDNLDYILSSLIEDEKEELALSIIEAWILQHGAGLSKTKKVIELFDSTFRNLYKNTAIRSRVITEWMVRNEYEMPLAVEAILAELNIHGIHNIKFSAEVVRDFDKEDLILLIGRMLGFVTYEEHLLSLLISLLAIDGADQSLPRLVEEALINEVGIDFPAMTGDRLRKLKSESNDNQIQEMCDRVIVSIDTYFNTLNELPRIKELTPSKDLQIKIGKQRAKTMEVHQKAANENSIIQQIGTHIPLKAGRASFSLRNGAMSEVSHLQSFEHSFTLPMRHVLDTVGYELSRLRYRTSKKGK